MLVSVYSHSLSIQPIYNCLQQTDLCLPPNQPKHVMQNEAGSFEGTLGVSGPRASGSPFQDHILALALLQKEAGHRQLPSAVEEHRLPCPALPGSFPGPCSFYGILARPYVNPNCYSVLPLTASIYSWICIEIERCIGARISELERNLKTVIATIL